MKTIQPKGGTLSAISLPKAIKYNGKMYKSDRMVKRTWF